MTYVWADMCKQFAGSTIKSVPISAMRYDEQKIPYPQKMIVKKKAIF